MKRWFVSLLVVLCCVSHEKEVSFAESINCSNIECINRYAQKGNAQYQFILGVCYKYGLKGLYQNYHEANVWFEKSADQNYAESQYMLGIAYEEGLGVRQNYFEAKEWYGKACDNGDQRGCDAYTRLNSGGR